MDRIDIFSKNLKKVDYLLNSNNKFLHPLLLNHIDIYRSTTHLTTGDIFLFEKEYHNENEGDMGVRSIFSIDWLDNFLMIYGSWDKLPNWKVLREHYDKTWTYYKDRDNIINTLLN